MKRIRDFLAAPLILVAFAALWFVVIPFGLLAKIVKGKP